MIRMSLEPIIPTIELSPEEALNRFYVDYYNWLQRGAPKHDTFARSSALCASAHRWMYHNRIIAEGSWDYMESQFEEAGLDTSFPFGGRSIYDMDHFNATMHLNPERIKWVLRQYTEATN